MAKLSASVTRSAASITERSSTAGPRSAPMPSTGSRVGPGHAGSTQSASPEPRGSASTMRAPGQAPRR